MAGITSSVRMLLEIIPPTIGAAMRFITLAPAPEPQLMPQAPMKHATTYVVHLSPGLEDTAGHMINMAPGTMMGGWTVSGSMMGGGSMMNGQWGPGMMGAGWQAADGTFGMMFSFTTA